MHKGDGSSSENKKQAENSALWTEYYADFNNWYAENLSEFNLSIDKKQKLFDVYTA